MSCETGDGNCGNSVCRREGCQGRHHHFRTQDAIESDLVTVWRNGLMVAVRKNPDRIIAEDITS